MFDGWLLLFRSSIGLLCVLFLWMGCFVVGDETSAFYYYSSVRKDILEVYAGDRYYLCKS